MLHFAARNAPVVIVDDDASARDALSFLLKTEGFLPETYGDGNSFLEALHSVRPSCVIIDLQLPDSSGLAVLKRLADAQFAPPVFTVSGQPDISMVVEAMKLGARDFLEKPFSMRVMVDRIRQAVIDYRRSTSGQIAGLADFPGRHLLTRRERDVLAEVARGASSKEAGRRLRISPRTIEVHRARIMKKLGARNAADLMRIVLSAAPSRANARAI